MNGFIKIHKRIVSWEWYTDPNTFRLFIHLLLNANFKSNRWQGIEIVPGQLVTGRKQLSIDLKLSEQEIRTSISKLKSTNEITIKSTNKFSIVTICKWEDYQTNYKDDQPTNQPIDQQTINQQSTTLEEGKEIKKKERVKFTPPSLSEFQKYFADNGYSQIIAERAFKGYEVADWKDSRGNQIKNWKQKCCHVWFKPENLNNKINEFSQPKINTPKAWTR